MASHTHKVWLLGSIHGTYASPQPTPHDPFIVLTTLDNLNLSLSLPCVPLSVEQALTPPQRQEKGCPVLFVERDQGRPPGNSVLS